MRQRHLSRFVSASLVLLTAGLVLFVACRHADAQKPTSGAPASVPYTREIVVDASAGQVNVTPRISLVQPGGTVTFVVKGLGTGQTVEIDFRVENVFDEKGALLKAWKGPYTALGDQVRGRYTFSAGSGPVTVTYQQDLGDGVWKYDVVLRDGKTDVRAVDPMTVGKGG
jgi:hypothetical protein